MIEDYADRMGSVAHGIMHVNTQMRNEIDITYHSQYILSKASIDLTLDCKLQS